MKRTILSIVAVAALAMTSCKKNEPVDQLGDATINGNIWAYLDATNDINAQGIYIANLNPEVVASMPISVEVNTMNWDQNPDYSYDYAKKTYTTTTDASGNYTLTIPATDEGYNVTVRLGDLFTERKSYAADGTTVITDNVKVGGNSFNVFIYKGGVINTSNQANVNTVSGSTNDYGSATVRIQVQANWNQGPSSTAFYDNLTGSDVVGKTVEISYVPGWAPHYTGYETIWTGTVPANGLVEFTIPTWSAASTNQTQVKYRIADFIGNMIVDDGGSDSTVPATWDFSVTNSGTFLNGDIITVNLTANVNPL